MKTLLIFLFLTGNLCAAAPLFETTLVFPNAPKNRPNYRIPAILQAPNGDLLIFAEKRNDGPGDVGNTDIVCKRSRDKGHTWSAEQVIFDDGNRCCTDITVGIERDAKTIWLFFLRDKKQYAYFTSTDSGATWQGPVSIHEQVTKPEWDKLGGKTKSRTEWEKGWAQRYGVGPGNAMVQLESGRLVVPARHREDTGGGRLRSFAHCFYSDDRGATWKLGGSVGVNTSECQLVELANGELMLVSRDESSEDSPANLRHRVAVSKDGGATWGPVRRAEELITPRCHGAVERYDKGRLLFSSPASPFRQKEHPYGRTNLTVRVSCDEGATWSVGRTIWPHPSSYSDIAVLDDGTVALVYERGDEGSTHYWDELHFVRFHLEWCKAVAVGISDDFVAYIQRAANGDNFGLRADGRLYPYSTPQGRRIGWRQAVWDKTLFAKGCTKAEAEQRLRADLERTLAALRATDPGLDQRQEETLLDFAYTEGLNNLKPEFVAAVLAKDWERIVKEHLYVRYAGHAPDHPRNKAFFQRITSAAGATGP
ncbi:MAG: hypothetical protein FJ395_14175 [Verrucomicrobia bacterium]|nr:hypothetical protein [Verrucomicrobiota bacterium]